MHVLVIGCGAAGAAAAIAAAEAGCRVTVADKNRKPLKKLGVTGNGRGNLMNLGPLRYYGDEAFAKKVLECVSPERVRHFLTDCGISLTADEENRVYPSSYMASAAVEALLCRLETLPVQLEQNVEITSVKKSGSGFCAEGVQSLYAPSVIKHNGKEKKGELLSQKMVSFFADRVILAAGGKAAPAHGTDGSAYALAAGHPLVEPRPALSPLLSDSRLLKGLEGIRVKAVLRLVSAAGQLRHETEGEALFTEGGISGIAAMQLARFYEAGCTLSLDLTQSLTGGECAQPWLENRLAGRRDLPLSRLFTGAALPQLAFSLLRAAGLRDESRPASTLTGEEKQRLLHAITHFSLPLTGVKGFEAAQVTAGGLDASRVDPRSMESLLTPGLYLAGEMLNVDGDCGGYNLMFAFASGLLAGQSAAG